MKNHNITVSAPGKIHLLGEHTVVYGKPALLAAIDLRVTVILNPSPVILNEVKDLPRMRDSNKLRDSCATAKAMAARGRFAQNDNLKKIIEPIIKKQLKIKQIPPYKLEISSQIPIGAGLGSSAAVSASYIAALLSHLGHKWDLNLINKLTFEAEKVFHGNPSGGDNTTVVFGGLIWFVKGKPIQPLLFTIPPKLAKNFILINTGKPKETTKEMVEMVSAQFPGLAKRSGAGTVHGSRFKKLFDRQEQLVKELLLTIQSGNENQLIQIIKAGEKNLEAIGVVSSYVKSIIRKIEKAGGAAKICGAGGKEKSTGILLCYHKNRKIVEQIAKSYNLDSFSVKLGVEGIKAHFKTSLRGGSAATDVAIYPN